MKNWSSISVTVLVAFLFLTSCYLTAEETGESRYPQPGATGNAGNIPFIGKKDAQGNPVRLARRTGHVSNYDEAKVKDYTLPDPLRCSDGTSVKRPFTIIPKATNLSPKIGNCSWILRNNILLPGPNKPIRENTRLVR